MSESAQRGGPESVEVLGAAETASPDEADEAVESAEADERTAADAPTRVFVADEVLLGSVDLARRALLEVTAPETVGSVIGHLAEDEHVLTLLFAADLSGYPGWRWSVTLARVEDGEPTVLETELMPGEAALLAPEWVPWSERLADYRAAQEAAAAAAEASADDAGTSLVDDDDDDDDDDDEFDDGDDFDDDDDDDDDFESGDEDAELSAAFGDDGDDEFDGIDIDALDESVSADGGTDVVDGGAGRRQRAADQDGEVER